MVFQALTSFWRGLCKQRLAPSQTNQATATRELFQEEEEGWGEREEGERKVAMEWPVVCTVHSCGKDVTADDWCVTI